MSINPLLKDYLPVDPVYGKGLKEVSICDAETWTQKRESIARRVRFILGEGPEIEGPFEVEVLSEERRETGLLQRQIRFSSGTGDQITGYLLVPPARPSGERLPAMLAMHSTIAPGAAVTVGVEQVRENRYYGLELARRGYVVLAIDVITAGERVYPGDEPFETEAFDRRFPEWSAMGKMLSDHQRAIDYLVSLPEVDPERIGVIGHSLGGYNAFFLQAFDERVKAAVTSCGFTPLGETTSPFSFARDQWFVHVSRMRDFLRSGIVPFDLHEVMALAAPRPLFNYSARQDHIFPSWAAIDEGLRQVGEVYEILGAGSAFERIDGEGDHDFPDDVREAAYEWLDRWLVF